MPRLKRIQIEGALYYVTNRGIQGLNIFIDQEDYFIFLELLKKYKAQHRFSLFAFVLLPTHIHLLVETEPQTTLSEIMHNLTSAYTKYYNKKYRRQGHLFRGRFKATLIEKEPNLLRLIRHIHLNPRTANAAQDLGAYPYSSYLYYTQAQSVPAGAKLDCEREVAQVRSYLGTRSMEEYVREVTPQEGAALHRELHRKPYLGSADFGKLIEERVRQEVPEARSAREGADKTRARYVIWPVVSGVMLATLAASALIYTQKISKRARLAMTQENAQTATPAVQEIAFELVGLDNTLWQIKFVAGTPFQTVDTLKFEKGRMSSENLALNGFGETNYSLIKQSDRVIWETMQSSPAATASWRGEVERGKMMGVLSLRQKDGASQDFSFVSLKYTRI